jgi:YggT family protein
MWTLISTIIIFLHLFYYLIIIDIILSWLSLALPNIRPKFIANLIDPIYNSIKKVVPTTIWWLDFTPIIVILFITFLMNLIMQNFT